MRDLFDSDEEDLKKDNFPKNTNYLEREKEIKEKQIKGWNIYISLIILALLGEAIYIVVLIIIGDIKWYTKDSSY